MSNRNIGICFAVIALIIVVLFLFAYSREPAEDVTVVYIPITPEPTATVTEEPTVVPTPTPIYIQVTPEPTEQQPQIIYITPVPTAVVTEEPTLAPTPTPIYIQVTPEPTEQQPPVIYITPDPTAEPTQVPTMVPTNVPTVEPTVVPTSVPTEVPTTAPTVDVAVLYSKLEEEITTLVMRGGIYLDYYTDPQYDLYNYINVDNLDSNLLFNLLRKPFENGIANWIDMEFVRDYSSLNRLSFALESSVCDSCGRVRISSCPENQSAITTIFVEIQQRGECEKANQILLDFLYKYTVKNPNNPYERLFVACND